MDRRKFLKLSAFTGIAASAAPSLLLEALTPLPVKAADGVDWPDQAFSDGWVMMDGGTLDVGVMRDTAQAPTNQFTMFVESFEGLTSHGRIDGGRTEVRFTPLTVAV